MRRRFSVYPIARIRKDTVQGMPMIGALQRHLNGAVEILRVSLIASFALAIAGCGEIRNSSRLVQQLDTPLVAGIGDTIVTIETNESMPNIVGKADIWGRTRPTGKIFLVFLGVENGRVTFERNSVRIQSNATTMNSSPIIIPQSSTSNYGSNTFVRGSTPSGTFSGTAVSSGIATTSSTPIEIPPAGSNTEVLSDNLMRYSLDMNKSRKLVVAGYEILIDSVSDLTVKYRIKKLRS